MRAMSSLKTPPGSLCITILHPEFLTHFDHVVCRSLAFSVTPAGKRALAQPALFASTPDSIRHASLKRQCEFLAGRRCAQQALEAFGVRDCVVTIQPDRSPHWPKGYVGSISHVVNRTGLAMAVVASRQHYSHLGVDVESVLSSEQAAEIQSLICVPDELDALTPASLTPNALLTLIFSAKESLFKALSQDVGYVFGFDAASTCSVDKTHIRLRLQCDLSPTWTAGKVLSVRYQQTSETPPKTTTEAMPETATDAPIGFTDAFITTFLAIPHRTKTTTG